MTFEVEFFPAGYVALQSSPLAVAFVQLVGLNSSEVEANQ